MPEKTSIFAPVYAPAAAEAARSELRRHQALLSSGALQSAILASPDLALIATDTQGMIQVFNAGAARLLGYTEAEVVDQVTPAHLCEPLETLARAVMLGREFGTVLAPGFEALVFKAARGIEDSYEQTCIRKDGSRFAAILSVTALRAEPEGIIGYLLIASDDSARRQLDEKNRWAEESFRMMVNSVTDHALVMLDAAGRVLSWNAGAQRIQGYSAEEIVGQHFSRFYPPQEIEGGAAQRDLDATTASGRCEVEGWRLRQDGSTFWANLAFTAIRDAAGSLRGYVVLIRDQTEARQLAADLATARSLAEHARLATADFLSDMSHELRTSLNAILGFAQLLESDTPPPTPAQQDSIAKILQAGWYVMELNKEILDLALLESGRLAWSLEPLALADVVRECHDTVEAQAQKSGIRLAFPEVAADVFVKADRTRVKQVLVNLVSNAIKYNQSGGSVLVECMASTPHRLRITVTDTGAGLDAEALAQLFRPFSRVGQETGATASSGIGLVVTKRVVELMGGSIEVSSRVGVGSVFTIELLTAAAPHLADDALIPEAPQARDDAAPHTLLYVEDNPANLQLVEKLVARRPDLRLLTAIDAKLGIALAQSAQPDLILMDINLPGMNGIDAMQILRADAATAAIPIVALSANAMPSDIERGLDAGFFRYLTKPIKVGEFMDTLDAALEFAAQKDRS